MHALTEKYTRGVSAVESILTLDRLRQSVAIKELEQSHGQSLSMRKTVSVPNFSQVRYNGLRVKHRANVSCALPPHFLYSRLFLTQFWGTFFSLFLLLLFIHRCRWVDFFQIFFLSNKNKMQ